MKQKTLNLIVISAATAAFCGLLFAEGAGPLVPPGPPADGTYRTLGELWDKLEAVEAKAAALESRTDVLTLPAGVSSMHDITAPGSYYLSGNLDVTAQVGIRIDSDGVTS